MRKSRYAERREKECQILIHAILSIGLVVVAYPLLFMVFNSVKTGVDIYYYPFKIPGNLNFKGYKAVFGQLDILRLFSNTVILASLVTILTVIFSAMVAYALAKINFKGRKMVFKILLASMMIPGIILMIPTYIMLYNWNWVNTYLPLIIPVVISAYDIFLVRQFISQIPDDFIESAKLDGANHMHIFFKIVLPMSVPVLSTVAILAFMGVWNDLMGPLLYLRDENLFTIQYGVWRFNVDLQIEQLDSRWASLVLASVPVMFVYMFAQKYFMKAFSSFGLK